jgi:hypothetical protein
MFSFLNMLIKTLTLTAAVHVSFKQRQELRCLPSGETVYVMRVVKYNKVHVFGNNTNKSKLRVQNN